MLLLLGCTHTYSIGDYYKSSADEGIVVEINGDGQPSMLLSLFEISDIDADSALRWSAALDAGWSLPDNEQMLHIRKYRAVINTTLTQRSLPTVMHNHTFYWTSTAGEKSHHYAMGPNGLKLYFHSNHSPYYRARAVKNLY